MVITQATSFDEYARQLMIPPAVMDLANKASNIRLSAWEIEGIRAELEPNSEPKGILREILEYKIKTKTEDYYKNIKGDDSHPPYIRVACEGKGDFDELAMEHLRKKQKNRELLELYGDSDRGDYGSPAVLEIWPAQHYSPIHSHGGTTGIIYCLTGQVDVMAYEDLNWNADKLGLLTLTPGQCAWLAGKNFAVHKVYCPMDGGSKAVGPGNLLNATSDYAATFHVYLNKNETASEYAAPKSGTRELFEFVNEEKPHGLGTFTTYSDLSWSILRMILADYAAFEPVIRA